MQADDSQRCKSQISQPDRARSSPTNRPLFETRPGARVRCTAESLHSTTDDPVCCTVVLVHTEPAAERDCPGGLSAVSCMVLFLLFLLFLLFPLHAQRRFTRTATGAEDRADPERQVTLRVILRWKDKEHLTLAETSSALYRAHGFGS